MSEENTSIEHAHGGTPPPAVDLTPLEQRLNRITEAVTTLTKRDRERDIQSATSRLRDYEGQLNTNLRQAEQSVDAAERSLAAAYEEGDPGKIAKATRSVTDAVAQREAARLEKRDFERAKARNEQQGADASSRSSSERTSDTAKDTTNLDRWKDTHKEWYGIDKEMTKAAHEIDRQIREAGVIPVGSKDYFRAIDRQLAQKYPNRFRSAPNTSGNGGASFTSGGQPSAGTGRIPRDVLDTWRRMGINVDDDKVLEGMVRNRERLVEKGILPQTPAYGRVS